jgi:hypothetical protein
MDQRRRLRTPVLDVRTCKRRTGRSKEDPIGKHVQESGHELLKTRAKEVDTHNFSKTNVTNYADTSRE